MRVSILIPLKLFVLNLTNGIWGGAEEVIEQDGCYITLSDGTKIERVVDFEYKVVEGFNTVYMNK